MANTNATIGYLSVVGPSTENSPFSEKNRTSREGWTGGLLVLNRGGRPIEFQCTLPIRPSRTHTILFGETLAQHLVGETIAPALLSRCRTALSILLCDRSEVLDAGLDQKHLIALTGSKPAESGWEPAELAGTTIWVPSSQHQKAVEVLSALHDIPDAMEPFERIRDAIREAQSTTSASSSKSQASHDASHAVEHRADSVGHPHSTVPKRTAA